MDEKMLGIGEFSRLSGIGRKTLIFYDREGVFPPARIGKNRYRLYSPRQLQIANVIVALRAMNVSLAGIKAFLAVRTPNRLAALCARQLRGIRAELEKLERIEEMVRSLELSTKDAAGARPGTMGVAELPAARLFMGPEIASTDMDDINAALLSFYELCARKNVPQTYPLGSVTSLAGITAKSVFRPRCFYSPAGRTVPRRLTTTRPGGRYLIGYARGDYGMLDGLYRRMLAWAKRRGRATVGDAYEEYVLSEMAVANPDSYLARVAIRLA